jgi:hypothetical protein
VIIASRFRGFRFSLCPLRRPETRVVNGRALLLAQRVEPELDVLVSEDVRNDEPLQGYRFEDVAPRAPE